MSMENNFEARVMDEMLMDQAYERAENIIEKDAIKIDNQFSYHKDADRDRAYVEKMEDEFEREATPEEKEVSKIATVFETLVYTHGELSNWFGKDAVTIKTSRYDDIVNKIDSLVEFRKEPGSASYLGLAIDVTMSKEMDEKLESIRKQIDSGKLSEVKYFHSKHIGMTGTLHDVPRVIAAANQGTIRQLTELWMENDNKALANHWIQFQMLESMLLQAKTFKRYAESRNKPDVAQTYDSAITTLEAILFDKKREVKDSGERDSAFIAIEERLKHFGETPQKTAGPETGRRRPKDTIRVWRP